MGEWVRWDTGRAVRMTQTPSGLVSRGWTEVPGDFVAQYCTTLTVASLSPWSWPSAPSPLHSHSPFPARLFSGPPKLSSSSAPLVVLQSKLYLEREPRAGATSRPSFASVGPALGWSPGQAPEPQGDAQPDPRLTATLMREMREEPSGRKHGHQPLHSKQPGDRGSGLELTRLVLLPS